ncbi:MAG TPA: hypothetical protein VFE12_16045, partial [Acetobacteraceae bacterium]|nr:hypothetical protein [Acetobacteraceae bacterium]
MALDVLSAAIEHLVQEATVALCGVGRLEDAEVGREVDEAIVAALTLVQVDDRLVGRVRRVDGEPRDAIDLLVGANTSESGTVCQRLPRVNIESD